MKKPVQRAGWLHGLRIALASSGLDQDETASQPETTRQQASQRHGLLGVRSGRLGVEPSPNRIKLAESAGAIPHAKYRNHL